MAKPTIKTKKKVSLAPVNVRITARKGTVSSLAVTTAAKKRKAESSSGNTLALGFWNIDLSNTDWSTIILPSGFSLASFYEDKPTAKSPDIPPSATNSLYVRSMQTESTTSLQRVTYVFPVSPNEVNTSRLGISYTELSRPGRKPILKSVNIPLEQISVTVLVVGADKSYLSSAQPQIDAIKSLAAIDSDLEIFYAGVNPSKKWRMTDLSFRTVRRNNANLITLAEADITFTEVQSLPSPVPGMPRLKDVPRSRRSSTNPGATSDDQRDTSLDADIAAIIAAGAIPKNPGTSGGGTPSE